VGRTEPAGYTDIVNTVIPTAAPLFFFACYHLPQPSP
jgi:hypothetical protein